MSVIIESLDQEGRGIAHENGKVLFIEGALPGETVAYLSFKKKPAYELAQATQILKQSFLRVAPRCKYFGVCGGCSMQHLDARAQVAAKQRVLEDTLWHIGKVRAKTVLPAIYGLAWGYRHRARLSVRYVQKKGGVLVGFHEKRNSFIVDMHSCEVLPEHISALIDPMRELIGNLSIRESIPQIELALGDAADVLLLRILESLSEADEQLLKDFSDQHNVQFYLQSKGPDTVYRFWPQNAPELNYGLPEFGIVMPFQPTEFTQVNPAVNRVMVRRAMRLLAPQVGERIADLFCGLGNFSLPIAKRGAMVVGIEGSLTLVERAQANAERNGLAERAEFLQANLFAATEDSLAQLGKFDKMLIDPPRDGAMDIVKALAAPFPERIVYVSCNPATLARDAEVLVHQKGYALKAAGVVNMFPHTGHIESMALFVRESDLSCA